MCQYAAKVKKTIKVLNLFKTIYQWIDRIFSWIDSLYGFFYRKEQLF